MDINGVLKTHGVGTRELKYGRYVRFDKLTGRKTPGELHVGTFSNVQTKMFREGDFLIINGENLYYYNEYGELMWSKTVDEIYNYTLKDIIKYDGYLYYLISISTSSCKLKRINIFTGAFEEYLTFDNVPKHNSYNRPKTYGFVINPLNNNDIEFIIFVYDSNYNYAIKYNKNGEKISQKLFSQTCYNIVWTYLDKNNNQIVIQWDSDNQLNIIMTIELDTLDISIKYREKIHCCTIYSDYLYKCIYNNTERRLIKAPLSNLTSFEWDVAGKIEAYSINYMMSLYDGTILVSTGGNLYSIDKNTGLIQFFCESQIEKPSYGCFNITSYTSNYFIDPADTSKGKKVDSNIFFYKLRRL